MEQLREQCRNYQPSLEVALWSNVINVGFTVLQLVNNYSSPEGEEDVLAQYIALTDLLFWEVQPIFSLENKEKFIADLFLNDNKRLFTMIQSIFLHETQNGSLEFIRTLFCLYETHLLTAVRRKDKEGIQQAVLKFQLLLVSLSIYSECNQANEAAVEHFLNIFNFLFQLRDQDVFAHLQPVVDVLISVIKIKPNGFTYTLFKRQLVPNIDELDSSIVDSSQFRAYLLQAAENNFGLQSQKLKQALSNYQFSHSSKPIPQFDQN